MFLLQILYFSHSLYGYTNIIHTIQYGYGTDCTLYCAHKTTNWSKPDRRAEGRNIIYFGYSEVEQNRTEVCVYIRENVFFLVNIVLIDIIIIIKFIQWRGLCFIILWIFNQSNKSSFYMQIHWGRVGDEAIDEHLLTFQTNSRYDRLPAVLPPTRVHWWRLSLVKEGLGCIYVMMLW